MNTDTKTTAFDTFNFPLKVFYGLCTDSVCSRWFLLISNHRKRN